MQLRGFLSAITSVAAALLTGKSKAETPPWDYKYAYTTHFGCKECDVYVHEEVVAVPPPTGVDKPCSCVRYLHRFAIFKETGKRHDLPTLGSLESNGYTFSTQVG